MKPPLANGAERLAYYSQQAAIAAQMAAECNNQVDRDIWLKIADEWQSLHQTLARDLMDPQGPHAADSN
jgi:hypothetical protein